MVTTNSIKKKIDNVLADTSVFAMMVLEKPLQELHTEIDLVTTPRRAYQWRWCMHWLSITELRGAL